MKNYRLKLIVSCAALAALWFCFTALFFLVLSTVLSRYLSDDSMAIYNLMVYLGSVAGSLAASALSIPFAVWTFKKLKIQYPLLSAIGYFMAIVFAFNLFAFIIGFWHFNSIEVYSMMATSFIIAGVLYGTIIRSLKHILTRGKFIFVSIGLALLPAVLWAIWHLLVTKSL